MTRPVEPLWTASERVVEPGPGAERYQAGYDRYLDHLAAARPLWATP